jgi:hypothetical protein
MSAYDPWGERASITVNGENTFVTGGHGANTFMMVQIRLPPSRTSSVIFVTQSGMPSYTRPFMLGFVGNSMVLPTGCDYVDDLELLTGDTWDV